MVQTNQTGEAEGITWAGPEGSPNVEFPRIVLQQILTYVHDGLRKLSRGGLETGGILFGRRAGSGIQVHAWRPIACEHTRGPAFLLSNNDRQALATQLEKAESDAALQVLEPVGWFVSHTRQGLVLSEEDRDLFNQFFSGPNRFGIVLHARKGQSTETALFMRDARAELPAEPTLRSFDPREFPPVVLPAMDGEEPANSVVTRPPRPRHAESEVAKAVTNSAAAVGNEVSAFWRRVPGWAYACMGVLLCGALVLAIPMRRGVDREGPEALQLRLQDSQGQLRIEWDRNSSTIRGAQSATLYITDGRPLAPIPLDRDTAQKGFIHYGRLSEDITVRLVVNRPDEPPFQELARFVGAPIPKEMPKELQESRGKRDQLLDEIRKLRAQIEREVERSQTLESTVARIEQQIEREARRK